MEDKLLDRVAWTSQDYLGCPIRGIILRFAGLGNTDMKVGGGDPMELEWSNLGGLVVQPFHEPWAWMNPPAQKFVDELIDALLLRHQLPASTPLIATGGSMGGHGALVYSRYSRHRVIACLALWPVCDAVFHYHERVDLPRTMHHAFGSYGDIEPALLRHSPLHLADQMLDIPYLIVHGEQDKAVSKSGHSDKFVAAMRALGRRIEYVEVANLGHGGPMDYRTYRRIVDFVAEMLTAADEKRRIPS